MIINLNPDLVEVKHPPGAREYSFHSDVRHQLNLGYKAEYYIHREPNIPEGGQYQSGLLGMLAKSYGRHIPVALGPHDIWFFLMTELAKVIGENVEACRPLFTTASTQDGKTKIEIVVNDPTNLTAAIPQFEARLRELVPVDLGTFVPDFTTSTPASRLATMAAFMDGVQHYYSYEMFLCGIPRIKVLGTIEDWTLIRDRFGEIFAMFLKVGVNFTPWLGRVAQIINRIIETLAGEDHSEWWKSIFTTRNVGSGRQLRVNGWFVDLYWKSKASQFEEFMFSWAVVPFTNLHEPDVDYRSIHGPIIERRDPDGFLYAEYGDATVVVGENAKEMTPPRRASAPAANDIPLPGGHTIQVEKVEVKATSRKLTAQWVFEGCETYIFHAGMTESKEPEKVVDVEALVDDERAWEMVNGIMVPVMVRDQ